MTDIHVALISNFVKAVGLDSSAQGSTSITACIAYKYSHPANED